MFRHIQDFAYLEFISNQQKQGKKSSIAKE